MKIIKFEPAKTGMLLIKMDSEDSSMDFIEIAKDWCKDQGENQSGEDIYEFIEMDTTYLINPIGIGYNKFRFFFKYVYRPNPVRIDVSGCGL